MERRRFVRTLCLGSVAALAGCDGTGGDGPDGANGDDPSVSTTEPSTDQPASGGGSGSNDAPGSTDVVFGDARVPATPNYRFRVDASGYDEASEDVVMEGSWNDGDFEMSVTGAGQGYRSIFVDGTFYYELDGQCVTLGDADQGSEVDAQEWADTDATVSELEDWAGLTAAGTTTIDGEEMYVFELTPEDHGVEATATYYVSAETGYFRRFESEGVVVEYWDWGQTDPIEAPC